jgi:hypothetical protein
MIWQNPNSDQATFWPRPSLGPSEAGHVCNRRSRRRRESSRSVGVDPESSVVRHRLRISSHPYRGCPRCPRRCGLIAASGPRRRATIRCVAPRSTQRDGRLTRDTTRRERSAQFRPSTRRATVSHRPGQSAFRIGSALLAQHCDMPRSGTCPCPWTRSVGWLVVPLSRS